MFQDNNIPVTNKDLIRLFFQTKASIKEKHKEVFLTEEDYTLNFNQLVNFAMTQESEEKFTQFMRIVKSRVKKTNKNFSSGNSINSYLAHKNSSGLDNDYNKSLSYKLFSQKSTISDEPFHDESEDKPRLNYNEIVYLPMTFNKILEYFNNKGKIRSNINKIKTAIVRLFVL